MLYYMKILNSVSFDAYDKIILLPNVTPFMLMYMYAMSHHKIQMRSKSDAEGPTNQHQILLTGK